MDHWFVRQALTGGRVIARKPTGEEVALETADPIEAARIKERLTRGFYGI